MTSGRGSAAEELGERTGHGSGRAEEAARGGSVWRINFKHKRTLSFEDGYQLSNHEKL